MKKITTLIISLLSIVTMFGQTGSIEGKVIDVKTQQSISGVHIIVNKSIYGAVTNYDGYYKLIGVPKGIYKLTISIIGYKKIIKKIKIIEGRTRKIDFKLEEFTQNLEEVQITVKTKARELREKAMPVSIISIKDIQGTVSSVNDVLTKVAGVKIRTSGGVGSASRISVRGLEGKRIGFFIDEIPLGEQSDFIGLNDIPLDLIERIEVYKGIVPAKFGGSAIGGAINIVTKEYPPQYIDISYGMQSYNTHNISAVIKKNKIESGYEFGVGGFYTYSDNNYTMESPFQKGLSIKRDHDVFEKQVIAGGFKAKKWWFDEVGFEPVYIHTKKEIQGIQQNIQEAVTYSDAYILANHIEKNDFLLPGLDFDFSLVYAYTIFKLQDKALQRYNFDGTTYDPVHPLGGEIGTNPNDSYNQKHTIFQKTNLNYILNEKSTLNLNTVFNYVRGLPEDELKDKVIGHKTNFESTMKNFVAGLTYEVRFLEDKLMNSLAVKYYYYTIKTTLTDIAGSGTKPHNPSQSEFGFSNAIRYRFTDEFLIKASYAYDVRLPSENELLGDGFIISPSGDLKPERINSFNIGLLYDQRKTNNNKLQVEFNVFYNRLENMIRYSKNVLQAKYQNFGDMSILGADFDVKYDLTNNIFLYGNVTYQDLRDTRKTVGGSSAPNPTKGDRMPNIPYLYANAGFELHKENLFGGEKQNSKLYFESSFVEEFFYDFEQSVFQERRIPQSISYNMGLEHSFKNNNISIGLQINNITNEVLLSEFNYPLPGRTAGVKLRYIIK